MFFYCNYGSPTPPIPKRPHTHTHHNPQTHTLCMNVWKVDNTNSPHNCVLQKHTCPFVTHATHTHHTHPHTHTHNTHTHTHTQWSPVITGQMSRQRETAGLLSQPWLEPSQQPHCSLRPLEPLQRAKAFSPTQHLLLCMTPAHMPVNSSLH